MLSFVVAAGVGRVLAANPIMLADVITIKPEQTIQLPFHVGICILLPNVTQAACAISRQSVYDNDGIEFIWNKNTDYYKFNDESAYMINFLVNSNGYVCLKNKYPNDLKITLSYIAF